MGISVTLYRFQIELSDISRNVYETLDFRVAQHPSESLPYMLTRVFAFALNYQDGLEFSPTGLHDPDAAAMSIQDEHGGFKLLIEVGNPSAKRLHKATKSSRQVRVYTYKNPDHLLREFEDEKVHRIEAVKFFSFTPEFIDEVSQSLKKDNRWSLLYDEGRLNLQVGEKSIASELGVHSVME